MEMHELLIFLLHSCHFWALGPLCAEQTVKTQLAGLIVKAWQNINVCWEIHKWFLAKTA